MAAAGEGKVIACHNKAEFEAQMAKAKEDGKLVIIDFMSTWCPGCILMAPVYSVYASKYTAALFLEVNIQEVEEVAKNYDIPEIPNFYFIKNGETLENIATTDPDDLRDTIEKYYVGSTTPASSASAA